MTHDERLQLFNDHIGLAVNIAIKHWGATICGYDDFKQEALTALWEATETYDKDVDAFSTYATVYVHHSLTTYAKVTKFGHTGMNSNFQEAISIVRESHDKEMPLHKVLDTHRASQAVRTYANLLELGEEAFVSLSEPIMCQDSVTPLMVADLVSDECDIADAIQSKLYDEHILRIFDEEFVPMCIGRRSKNPERRKKLLHYYRQRIFGEKQTQKDISKKLGMSKNVVSIQFKKWDKQLAVLMKDRLGLTDMVLH